MEIEIRIDQGDVEDARDLGRWLSAEDRLRGRVRTVDSPPSSTELGGLPELVMVLLEGGGGAILASSLKTWLLTRVNKGSVIVTAGDRTVKVDLTTTQDVAASIERLLSAAKDV